LAQFRQAAWIIHGAAGRDAVGRHDDFARACHQNERDDQKKGKNGCGYHARYSGR
jgi:hypothetical protein